MECSIQYSSPSHKVVIDRMVKNPKMCEVCNKTHKSVKAQIQHLANTRCEALVVCLCGEAIDWHQSSGHLSTCNLLEPFKCNVIKCDNIIFKSLETFCAHVWCAHGQSKKEIDPMDFRFKIRAQIGTRTRFDHMQLEQLIDKTRNNTLRRFVLKQLVLESNFAAVNSKFLGLVRAHTIKVIPLFSSTEGKLMTYSIRTADGIFAVKLNIRDKDYNAIVSRLRPLCVARTQALFDSKVTVDLHHKFPTEGMEEMVNSCNSVLRTLGIASQNVIQRCISICCKIFIAFRIGFKDTKALCALFIDLLCSLNVGADLAMQAWEMIKQHLSSLRGFFTSLLPRAQIGADIVTSLVTVLAVCFSTVIVSRLPKECEINSIMKSVDSLGRSVRGATFAFDGMGKIVGKVVSHIFQAQYGVPTEIAELEVFMNGIQQWFVDVQAIVELGTFDRLEREPALCARVQELYRQGF
jgi:hypothetical protein